MVGGDLLSGCPAQPSCPSLEAGVGISVAYLDIGPLGSTQDAPGCTTEHFIVLVHVGCIVLRSSQWRHEDILQGDMIHSTEVSDIRNTPCFPQRTHPYSSRHSKDQNPTVRCQNKLQSATAEIKRGEANASQLESTPSGYQRKTKVRKKHVSLCLCARLACWMTHKGIQGIDQRRKPPQEQPGGRGNLLLHNQIYFWRDKSSKEEDTPHWCDHCLSSAMPHDCTWTWGSQLGTGCAPPLVGCCQVLLLAGHTLNDASPVNGYIERLPAFQYLTRQTSQNPSDPRADAACVCW